MCLFAEIRGSAAPPETAPTLQASQLLRQGAKLWLGGGQRSVTHSRICYSDVVKSRLYFLCFGEIRSSSRQLYCLHNTEHTQVTLCIHKHTCSLCWRAHTTWPWVAGQSPIICVLTEFVIFLSFCSLRSANQPAAACDHRAMAGGRGR